MALPGIELDGDRIGDSTAALSYTSVPKKLVVVGGGYIGLELGSVWSRLGAEVIILEAMDKVLGGLDQEIARAAQRTFEKQGLQFRTNMWVESVVRNGDSCTVSIKGGETIECDRVLVSAGRSPNTKSLGLDAEGVEVDQRGFITTDAHLKRPRQTSTQSGTVSAAPCLLTKLRRGHCCRRVSRQRCRPC